MRLLGHGNRCCEGALRDVPRVLVSAEGFLGDLRNQLAKKLRKTAGMPMTRLSCTVNNWMGDSFLSYVGLLEARGDRKVEKGLADYDIDAKNHQWKGIKKGTTSLHRGVSRLCRSWRLCASSKSWWCTWILLKDPETRRSVSVTKMLSF